MKLATLDIAGKKYTAEGETVQDALANLVFRGYPQSKALLTIKDENYEKTIVLPPILTKRFFHPNKVSREIALKQVSMRFD